MEENNTKKEMDKVEDKSKMMTYEQLEQVARQLQQRVMAAEGRLMSIDLTSIRLNWLFKVIEHKEFFKEDYVSKCVTEIEDLLTTEEDTPNNTEVKE